MNPFQVLESVQRDYLRYVGSFQLIDSEDVPPVLEQEIEHGRPLWTTPWTTASRRPSFWA